MTTMTMTEIAESAKTAAAAAYAACRFQLSMTYTNVLALAKDAIEAEKEENECTLALFSCFPSEEAEQEALEAERDAIAIADRARVAAFAAWEAAQDAYNAEEEEEVREYEARQAAHDAALAEAEEALQV